MEGGDVESELNREGNSQNSIGNVFQTSVERATPISRLFSAFPTNVWQSKRQTSTAFKVFKIRAISHRSFAALVILHLLHAVHAEGCDHHEHDFTLVFSMLSLGH